MYKGSLITLPFTRFYPFRPCRQKRGQEVWANQIAQKPTETIVSCKTSLPSGPDPSFCFYYLKRLSCFSLGAAVLGFRRLSFKVGLGSHRRQWRAEWEPSDYVDMSVIKDSDNWETREEMWGRDPLSENKELIMYVPVMWSKSPGKEPLNLPWLPKTLQKQMFLLWEEPKLQSLEFI